MVKTRVSRLRVIERPNGRDQSASMHSGPSILSGSPNECWLHTCHACVITTSRLGLRAPLVARNKKRLSSSILALGFSLCLLVWFSGRWSDPPGLFTRRERKILAPGRSWVIILAPCISCIQFTYRVVLVPSTRVFLGVLTIYTNHPGGNSVHKHKTIKFDVVGRRTASNYTQISWAD